MRAPRRPDRPCQHMVEQHQRGRGAVSDGKHEPRPTRRLGEHGAYVGDKRDDADGDHVLDAGEGRTVVIAYGNISKARLEVEF